MKTHGLSRWGEPASSNSSPQIISKPPQFLSQQSPEPERAFLYSTAFAWARCHQSLQPTHVSAQETLLPPVLVTLSRHLSPAQGCRQAWQCFLGTYSRTDWRTPLTKECKLNRPVPQDSLAVQPWQDIQLAGITKRPLYTRTSPETTEFSAWDRDTHRVILSWEAKPLFQQYNRLLANFSSQLGDVYLGLELHLYSHLFFSSLAFFLYWVTVTQELSNCARIAVWGRNINPTASSADSALDC